MSCISPSLAVFIAVALAFSSRLALAEEALALEASDSQESAAPVSPDSGSSNVLGALGKVAGETVGTGLRTRALAAESLVDAGLGLIELPPRAQMESNVEKAGSLLLGTDQMGALMDRYRAGEPARRKQVISEFGTLGALGLWSKTRRPQPASFYYDNFVRPKVLGRIDRIGRW